MTTTSPSLHDCTSQIVDVPVGPGLLGRVVDALGNPFNSKSPIEAIECCHASLKVSPLLGQPTYDDWS